MRASRCKRYAASMELARRRTTRGNRSRGGWCRRNGSVRKSRSQSCRSTSGCKPNSRVRITRSKMSSKKSCIAGCRQGNRGLPLAGTRAYSFVRGRPSFGVGGSSSSSLRSAFASRTCSAYVRQTLPTQVHTNQRRVDMHRLRIDQPGRHALFDRALEHIPV